MELIRHGKTFMTGSAKGELLSAEVGLSFWGGVDPQTGVVIDQHHPLPDDMLEIAAEGQRSDQPEAA